MSTDTLEPQADEAGIPDEGPSTIPMVADPDPIEVARAEDDGMPPPRERTTAEKLHDAEIAEQIEEATAEVCDLQEKAETKRLRAASQAEMAKDAKKAAEAADDDLREAARRLRKLREGRFPDGDKYPLLDGPKAEINATFPAPESIAPTPADTIEEHFRRKKRDTKLADVGLAPKVVEILEAGGYRMVIDLDKLGDKDLATIKNEAGSITEKRAEAIRDAIEQAASRWMDEWNEAHPPEGEGSVEETVADMDFEDGQ
jgi:hypothetical protein